MDEQDVAPPAVLLIVTSLAGNGGNDMQALLDLLAEVGDEDDEAR